MVFFFINTPISKMFKPFKQPVCKIFELSKKRTYIFEKKIKIKFRSPSAHSEEQQSTKHVVLRRIHSLQNANFRSEDQNHRVTIYLFSHEWSLYRILSTNNHMLKGTESYQNRIICACYPVLHASGIILLDCFKIIFKSFILI